MGDRTGLPAEAPVSTETALAVLEKILASRHFSNTRRLSDFLRFVVQKTASGEAAQIKEYLIALAVYGRRPDYDPKVDCIVRVEASRLRAKLRGYYESEGRTDPIRLQLPPGSYVPVFEPAPEPASADTPATIARRTPLRWLVAVSLAAFTTMAGLVPLTKRADNSRNSIAVLPFANTSGAAGKDYFSDGLTEQITNELGRSGKLQVAARSSAQQFKGSGDVRRIGEKLHVDMVLEGSVRFAGDRIHVTARLYETHRGGQIWSNEFSRAAGDVPALQDEISTAIAQALQLGPARTGARHVARGWTTSSEALDLYLQARYLFNSRKPENVRKSMRLYEAALQKDPKFALAYAGLADDYVVLGTNEEQEYSQMVPLARQAVEHALAIAPNLPDALLTRAAISEPGFASLERTFRAALEANPSNATGHHWYGLNLLAVGRFSEAEAEIRQAQILDPLSLHVGADLGMVYYYSGRYQEAVEQAQKLLALDPHLFRGLLLLAQGYEALGRYAEAAAILEKLEKADKRACVLADLGHVYTASGRPDQARKLIDALARMAKTRHVSPHQIALIQVGLGEKNEALALLEMSFEQHDAPLAFLKVDPRWAPLRGDPRFQQLLRELDLQN
jgi:serine/threonine-protein kinase